MRILVCAMLVGGALAHYYRSYDDRAIFHDDGNQYVKCPVCPKDSDPWEADECLKEDFPLRSIDGSRYKKCVFGTYVNEKCGYREDCYRGPGEPCTEHMDFDRVGKRCASGYTCSRLTHTCEGPGSPTNIREKTLVHQEPYDKPLRQRAAYTWNDYLRVRRQA